MAAPPLLIRAATATTSSSLAAANLATRSAAAAAGPSSLSPPLQRQQCYSTSSQSASSRHPRRPRSLSQSASSTFHRSFSSTPRTSASVKDPYAALGVKKSSSAKEIKSAYYDLAKKLHPDVNPDKSDKAKERFVEIQQAYDILSDDSKKQNFDQYGSPDGPGAAGFGGGNPFGGGSPFGGFGGFGGQAGAGNASDIFDSIFGAFGGGGAGGRARGAGFAGESRGDDLETGVNISFEEACRGATRSITINPIEKCSPCSGEGLKKGAKKTTCGVCNGTGTRTFVIQSGFQMASTCPACGGAGSSIAAGDACGSCDGVGRVRGKKTVQVKIPPGVDDGAKIRLEGAGDAPLSGPGPSGSLFVRINVRKSNVWRRQGSNLHFAAKVPLHVALLGGKVRVPTLDGDVDVRVPAGTQVGDEMLLRGRGVQSLMRRGEKGDLLVGFEVAIPRSLTKRQKEILQMYADEVEGKTSAASKPAPSPAPTASSAATPPPPSSAGAASKQQSSSSASETETASGSGSSSGTSSFSEGEASGSTSGGSGSGGLLGGFWKKLMGK